MWPVRARRLSYLLFSEGSLTQADKDVVLAMVTQDGSTLQYAAKALQQDKEIVLAAIAQCADALQYASAELQEDSEVARASSIGKANKELLLAMVAQDGSALRYASPILRADKEVVSIAVAQCSDALQFASPELQEDTEVSLVASTGGQQPSDSSPMEPEPQLAEEETLDETMAAVEGLMPGAKDKHQDALHELQSQSDVHVEKEE
jgi:hypothetical protein